MTLSKPSLPYDWPSAQRSGILSPERIAAINTEVAARTAPLVTDKGKAIENAYVLSFPDGTNWIYWISQYANLEYQQKELIAALLTPDELAAIKADSGRAYAARREAERFAKAIKGDDCEYGVFWGDTYYSTLDEALDVIADDWDGEYELPTYLWAAKPLEMVPEISASQVAERFMRDVDTSDMDFELRGMTELQVALDAFVAANQNIQYYETDYSTAVVIPAESLAEIRALCDESAL